MPAPRPAKRPPSRKAIAAAPLSAGVAERNALRLLPDDTAAPAGQSAARPDAPAAFNTAPGPHDPPSLQAAPADAGPRPADQTPPAVPPLAEARLLLAQLLSPAFPVGSYAYSQGLEVAMVEGTVHDAATLADWVEDALLYGSARIDAALIALARTPGADLDMLATLAQAYAPARERAAEMRDQGAAFAACATALGLATPDLPYPVAVGAATAALPLPTAEVIALYLHALAAQLTSAAVRFLPLSATEGQRLIARLAPAITRAAEGPHDLTSGHLAADLAAMAHETLQPRIFRS